MRSRCFVLVALAAVSLYVGCGDDGGGTGPGGGGGGNTTAKGFDAMADAFAATVGAFGPTYASVDALGGPIGELLGASKTQARALRAACVPASIADTVFDYDVETSSYVATEETGAPLGGARFKLYEVDDFGDPVVPLVPAGFYDIFCDEANATALVAVSDPSGASVADLEFVVLFVDPPNYIITTSEATLHGVAEGQGVALLFNADGAIGQSMGIGISVVGGLEFYAPGLAGYSVSGGLDDADLDAAGAPIPPYYGFGAGASQVDNAQNLLWNASVSGSVTGEAILLNIQQGEFVPFEFEDRVRETNGVLACFSGDYRNPTVQSSDLDCATGVIQNQIPLSATDLASIRQGYSALIEIVETMSRNLATVLPMIVR